MVNFEGKTAGLRSFEGLIFRTILIILVCCHGPTPMSLIHRDSEERAARDAGVIRKIYAINRSYFYLNLLICFIWNAIYLVQTWKDI